MQVLSIYIRRCSKLNNVSNNAVIRQVDSGISSQSNYLEAAWGERDSGMDEALGEHLYLNNDNAAVELSRQGRTSNR